MTFLLYTFLVLGVLCVGCLLEQLLTRRGDQS